MAVAYPQALLPFYAQRFVDMVATGVENVDINGRIGLMAGCDDRAVHKRRLDGVLHSTLTSLVHVAPQWEDQVIIED